ncbi:MAG: MFS transporter [Xanthobacteraceae bacterium]
MDATIARNETRLLSHRDARAIVLGVLLPVFMGSVDTTILASALPTIGRDLGNIHALPWLVTAYLIAATAVTPLYGKISDIRGRRATLAVSIAVYMAGSLICAFAPDMFVLILGRVVHGLGGGGLTSLAMIVLGDIAAPKDRGRYYAYFAITYSTAGATGPALGGFLADHVHWSMIFWLNIPLGLIALALTSSLLRRLPRYERSHRLDVIGAVLIMAASVCFMLALNVAGVRLPWTSLPILGLLALAAMLGGGFVARLMTAPEPLIPITILANPEARLAIIANAFGWGSIIGLNIFFPMFLQSGMGASATNAGLSLVVMMASLNLSAGAAGQLLGRVRHYKTVPMIGLAIAIASLATLAWQGENVSLWMFEVLVVLIGIGFGPLAPLSTVVLQNSVPIHQFGTAMGTMNFSRNLFCTIMVAVFGALVLGSGPGELAIQTPGLHPEVGSAEGFARVFLAAAASLSVALFCLLLLKEKPLHTDVAPAPE